MGNVICDSMLKATQKYGAVAAFMNAGGVRSGLPVGQINYGQLLEVQPFGNTLVVMQLSGRELLAALEEGASGGLLYPSAGTSYIIDTGRIPSHRVHNLVVAGKPVEADRMYTVTMNSYSASGGDKHVTLEKAKGTRQDTGIVDLSALIEYFKAGSPISMVDEHRVRH